MEPFVLSPLDRVISSPYETPTSSFSSSSKKTKHSLSSIILRNNTKDIIIPVPPGPPHIEPPCPSCAQEGGFLYRELENGYQSAIGESFTKQGTSNKRVYLFAHFYFAFIF
jgi:hypothetical protein